MALFEAYFDESGCHDGSRVLVVGGYIVRSDNARVMERKWRRKLQKYGVPYFHMVDCAQGAPPFDKLSMGQRINIEKDMIALIKRYTTFGFASLIPPHRYDQDEDLWDPYTFSLKGCEAALVSIFDSTDPHWEAVIFFEAGHQNGPKAADYLRRRRNEDPRLARHIQSYTFGAKQSSLCYRLPTYWRGNAPKISMIR